MAATQQYFLLSEVAARILPALCQLTTDPEKNVRDSVFRTIKGFLGKLEKVSEDPSLRESIGSFLSSPIKIIIKNTFDSNTQSFLLLNFRGRRACIYA